ncbi:MAG: hypothetical protein AUG49_25695 [Catenulispora sp. 13_1_20CM_3_70_7]|nr:MAG: hypothetical protein AUG49_25695 [Catenulispora sp. 13_1_20CM_3_70_7]
MSGMTLPSPALRAAARARASALLTRVPVNRLRVGLLADDVQWLFPIALGGFFLFTTWRWEFPNRDGIPYPPIWLGLLVTVLFAWRWRVGAISPIAAAAIVALTIMAITDVAWLFTQGFRDIGIYLKAGRHWLDGLPVYTDVPIHRVPPDLTNYPFLYPPLTLPLFGALGLLPLRVGYLVWLAVSAAAFWAGLRRVGGVDWRWWIVLFVWPPAMLGLWVGNVAIPLFFFFAVAPWRPWALAAGPIFKIYSGISGLWLLRREHWRSLVVAVLVVVGAVAVTLPLVGLERWREWIVGLQAYQVSQGLLHALYGFGLAGHLRWIVFLLVAALVVVLALAVRNRREQLARLGVATIVGSPSLYPHGFVVALPAMFRLDTPWCWLALGMTSFAPGLGWFIPIMFVIVSWYVPAMRKRPVADPWHPLGAAAEPWPSAPEWGPRTVSEPASRTAEPLDRVPARPSASQGST